ncbi:major facilitator superfamily domain-containing protein [Mycena sanguinolenta]|nr:major facilitator superfamily domain-containing protein [Mycena sanguinolenta]
MDKVSSRSSTDPEKDVDSSSVINDQLVVNDELERTVWRKLDIWIIPIVTLFYLLSFLDRTNIGNAKVAGLLKDLDMTPKQYSIALTVTYVPYIVAELPSNLLLKAVGLSLMLPTMLTLWGIVTACQGTIKTYGGLLACRFFLGLLEGGVLPGLVLYLSYFYPRLRLQTRINAFFSAASLSGAFGGIMAYGIINLSGKHGHSGWQWIFIIEGAITVAIGLSGYFLMPDTPDHPRFLNEEEKSYIKAKLKEDGAIAGDDADVFSWIEVVRAFTSIHVLLVAVMCFTGGTFHPVNSPISWIHRSKAQLMSVPPFSVALVVSVITSWISDRYQCRGAVTVFCSVLCTVGFGMFLGSENHKVQYGSLFLSIPGIYSLAPTVSTWNANNSAPHFRRSTAIAIGFIMTNSGGILATWVLSTLSAPPRYTMGTKLLLIFSVIMGFFAVLNIVYLKRENSKKQAQVDAGPREYDVKLGDKSPLFIYSL